MFSGFLDYAVSLDGLPLSLWRIRGDLGPQCFLPLTREDCTIKPGIKQLVAFAGLLPQKHSSGSSVRRPGRISRTGSERLRRALSSKRRNPAFTGFVKRLIAGKPSKVILLAIARKLLVLAHAIVRTQRLFEFSAD